MKIFYSAASVEDLGRIGEYYAERVSPQIARELTRRIKDTLDRVIRRNPQAGRRRVELGPEVRSFPVLPYVVFYSAAGRHVYVIRILHGHRDVRPPLASLLVAV